MVAPTALLGIAGGPVTLVSIAVALVGEVVARVGIAVALVGEVVALVGGPLPGVEVVLGPVQRRGPSGQPGLGGLQRLLGLPGPRLGRPDPGVVNGQGRDPLTLGLLHDLLGQFGQLARGRPRPSAELLERLVRTNPPGDGQDPPLACSIQTRLASACRN